MAALLIIVLYIWKEKGVTTSYRILSVAVLLLFIGCLMFKTVHNQWYLLQAILVILLTWILCGRKILYKKKMLYKKWKRKGEEKDGK